jgi:hypothetical protein
LACDKVQCPKRTPTHLEENLLGQSRDERETFKTPRRSSVVRVTFHSTAANRTDRATKGNFTQGNRTIPFQSDCIGQEWSYDCLMSETHIALACDKVQCPKRTPTHLEENLLGRSRDERETFKTPRRSLVVQVTFHSTRQIEETDSY